MLVEAKAHEKELNKESHGKRLDKKEASEDSIRNQIKIGSAINEENDEIKNNSLKSLFQEIIAINYPTVLLMHGGWITRIFRWF